jgi:NADP-reducing hydrogenase subunit HndD
MPTLTIDNRKIEVADGTTLLDASRQAGVHVPSLCYLKDVQAVGSCRVCLVEVEGAKTLVASCVTPAAEGMKVHTNSPKVREARRTIVDLILSDHEGDCQTCDRSGDCELQAVARDLGIREIAWSGAKSKRMTDASTPALVRDTAKCILCRRCVTVCGQTQGVAAIFPQRRGFNSVIGPAFAANLSEVVCVQCGQCAAVCPVGAIGERDQIAEVWKALDDPAKTVVVQTAPAIRAALGECFGYPPGTLVTGKMVTALRNLGFDRVFDTNFTADLTIMEEGTELLTRLKKALARDGAKVGVDTDVQTPTLARDGAKVGVALPMFTSCSPGWIRYAEHFYPDILPNISTCKSPQQMFGAVAKTYFAEKIGKRPEDIFVVSVMPCTAKKYEAQRPEMNSSGVRDVDVVLTTRELGRMITMAGIDFQNLPDGKMDSILGDSSGAADIFANTGGVMEAALRTAWEIVTGTPLPFENLHVKPLAGLDGIKTASARISGALPEWSFLEGVELKVAVAHGLGNARLLIERVKGGEPYHFIEIMTCPGGCIGGGGQPRMTTDDVRQARIQAIYQEDEGKPIRTSHRNPEVAKIYADYLTKPLGEKSHHLLHTRYTPRSRV